MSSTSEAKNKKQPLDEAVDLFASIMVSLIDEVGLAKKESQRVISNLSNNNGTNQKNNRVLPTQL